ncbi:hypothetical protein [Legionella quateirensis]|uniref:Uncharacterized protein n=1 Tax=Legionella quateirensis TaxID=45072 RepID=A0A378KQP1_9GAMM|nr:hypothetical protein [Legionella quateirensis]KTD55461.1 hypothetical protein Lqua_0178 [Legionella quateirensis]STY16636.1 Uncharacterised protein [Legionella quateirensis]
MPKTYPPSPDKTEENTSSIQNTRESNILQDELLRLKNYYNSLSWFSKWFFPRQIATALTENSQKSGLYQYKLIKSCTGWFSRFFFSGIRNYFNNIKNTEKTIEFLDQHGLIDYYVGDSKNHNSLIEMEGLQIAYKLVISENKVDKDTTIAAELLMHLERGKQDIYFKRQVRDIAQCLASYIKVNEDLSIDPNYLFERLQHASKNHNLASIVTPLIKAGLLDNTNWTKNLDILKSDEQELSHINRLFTWLSDGNQLNLLTQSRFDKIRERANPDSNHTDLGIIEDLVYSLTNQHEVSYPDGIIYKVNNKKPNLFSAELFDYILGLPGDVNSALLMIIRTLANTKLFNQHDLQLVLNHYMNTCPSNLYQNSANSARIYGSNLVALFDSGLLNNEKAQENFELFNQYCLETEHSNIGLDNLGKITQEQFEYYIHQTPAERNAQYEAKCEKYMTELQYGLHPNGFFTRNFTDSIDNAQQINLIIDERSEKTVHRQRNEATRVANVYLGNFYF